MIQTSWEGLPDKEDFTWQSLQELHEDVPDALTKLLTKSKKKKFVKKAKLMLKNKA